MQVMQSNCDCDCEALYRAKVYKRRRSSMYGEALCIRLLAPICQYCSILPKFHALSRTKFYYEKESSYIYVPQSLMYILCSRKLPQPKDHCNFLVNFRNLECFYGVPLTEMKVTKISLEFATKLAN